ncbi:MAG: TonB-dependent receptor plug domain-containing protein [Desulfuromonadales bacterium]|nr:TonB-dependent receptor plug domain-containing protein [Desulfuromonadales bacterium]
MTSRVATVFVAALLVALPALADTAVYGDADVKQEVATSENLAADIPALKQVTVVGQPENLITGKSELSSDTLQQLPGKNSSLTETITILPRVQIGEEQRTSENAAEILPPLISISGGRAYENYYSVDGVGMNSLIDPLADNQNAIDQVPGHPQRAFIHQDLIESVTVYDSNIPARFGRFVGGVVDARTRMPANNIGGKLSLRTTRDTWTQFQINQEDRDDFDNSNSFSQQPRFKKYDGGIELDVPVNEQMGFLGSYRRIQSDLELSHFGDRKQQHKTLETFFLKYAWVPQTPHSLELTTSYTPSEEDFFIADTRDSDFTIKRGGYSVNGIFRGDARIGSYELTAAYLENENSRIAPANFYTWRNTPSRSWGEDIGISRSREGGFGDVENTEQSVQLRADFLSHALVTGKLSHVINLGAEYTWDQAEYDRKETSLVHNASTPSSAVVCAPGDPACVDGEQYFSARNVYLAQSRDADINYFATYLEDLITWGPLQLRPGVRISHDDFLHNTNLTQRLAGSWDILNNGKTILIGGYNRYYGESFLTYKLREAIVPYLKETRSLDADTNQLSPWRFDIVSSATLDKYSDLDTPYSNEWTIGVVQQLLGGSLQLNYLERHNRDQFAKEKITEVIDGEDRNFYVLNNNGSSNYESIKVSWERKWLNNYLHINYTHSDQNSSNESYDDLFDGEDLEEVVWYEGKVIDNNDLPRLDYNREHMLNIIYAGRLPWNFTFTNVTRYLGEYDARNRLSAADKTDRGIATDLTAYERVTRPDYWIFDWRLDWQKAIRMEQSVMLSLEINNVFDRTPPAGASETTYELGRQFWLGMTYEF